MAQKGKPARASPITDAVTLCYRTDLMPPKPVAGMIRMESMVAMDTEYHKPPHYLSPGRLTRTRFSIRSNTGP